MASPAGLNVTYHNGSLLYSFVEHVKLVLKDDIGKRLPDAEANWIERSGDGILKTARNLYHYTWKLLKEPRFLTLALGILAQGALSYSFYPAATRHTIKAGLEYLPKISFETAKFATYLYFSSFIVGFTLRGEGRVCNSALKNQFYNNLKVPAEEVKVEGAPVDA